MKIILILFVAFAMNLQASWFGNDSRQQIRQLQTQLAKQQETSSHWQTAALLLAFFSIIALIGGTAIGSKARKEKHDL